MKNNVSSVIGYYLVAFVTVAIWGTTFVFTKILLHNGLSPALIFTLRFILAYVLMLIGSLATKRFKVFADSWRDVDGDGTEAAECGPFEYPGVVGRL